MYDDEEARQIGFLGGGTGRRSKVRGLARTIANCGRASRPEAEALVRAGRVCLNGTVVCDPAAPVGPADEIRVDDELVVDVVRRYFALHKPAGHVTGLGERERGRSIREFYPPGIPGLAAAGRLDAASTGLVLVSNDAAWNTRAAGGPGIDKEYLVHVPGAISELEVGVIAAGVRLPRLGFVKPLSVRIEEVTPAETIVRMVLLEGKNRQIRRLFHNLRYDNIRLHRVRIGPIALGELEPGHLRPLTAIEIDQIRRPRHTRHAPSDHARAYDMSAMRTPAGKSPAGDSGETPRSDG